MYAKGSETERGKEREREREKERVKHSSLIKKEKPNAEALERNVNFNPEEEAVAPPSRTSVEDGDSIEDYYDTDFDNENVLKRRTKCQQCKRYVYNKDDESFCGRTCNSWFKIIFYYLAFYAVVIGILLAFIYSAQTKYDTGRPGIPKHEIFPDASPGVVIFPSIWADRTYSIIWYLFHGEDSFNNRRADSYINLITELFQVQESNCKNDDCKFNKESFGPCGIPEYGYREKKPCIYLKLNKLERWYPESYGSRSELPSHMHEDMKKTINVTRACLYVKCQGQNSFDDDYLGEIDYYPEAAFHERNFPYKKSEDVNPIIAMQLSNIKPGHIISLECYLFAKNIKSYNERATTVLYVGIR